jgi:hypothetical protein
VDFKVTDQLLIRYPGFIRYWRRNGSIMGQYISYLYISRRSMAQSREKRSIVQHLNDFGIPMKLIRTIKMYLNKTYSEVHIGRNLIHFPIQNGLKQGDALLLLSTLLSNMLIRQSKKIWKD